MNAQAVALQSRVITLSGRISQVQERHYAENINVAPREAAAVALAIVALEAARNHHRADIADAFLEQGEAMMWLCDRR